MKKKSGPLLRLHTTAAGFLLCVHLWGMLLTSVLHPLYHTHSSASSCASGRIYLPSESSETDCCIGNDLSSSKSFSGGACLLCQWKVHQDFVAAIFQEPHNLYNLAAPYSGEYTENYYFEPQSHRKARAPPVFC